MGKAPSVVEIKKHLEEYDKARRENQVIKESSIEEIAMMRSLMQ